MGGVEVIILIMILGVLLPLLIMILGVLWPFNFARHYQYGRYVFRHKFFVFQECLKLNVNLWIAITHDWDKFLPGEWLPYARTFYQPDGQQQYNPEHGFAVSWNHHQKRNKHHWQYWYITWDTGDSECLPMPDVYRREMLADWRGAGRAIGMPDTKAWYEQNKQRMHLHPDTRIWIEQQLG